MYIEKLIEEDFQKTKNQCFNKDNVSEFTESYEDGEYYLNIRSRGYGPGLEMYVSDFDCVIADYRDVPYTEQCKREWIKFMYERMSARGLGEEYKKSFTEYWNKKREEIEKLSNNIINTL